jgi:hypothetical protein
MWGEIGFVEWEDNLAQSTHFREWVRKNPGEAKKLHDFIEAVTAVQRPHAVNWPDMHTPLGKVLVISAAAIGSHEPIPPVV